MRHALSAACCAALLAACGGGDGKQERANVGALPEALFAPACHACQPGMLHGQAAEGQALTQAQVLVVDTRNQQRTGQTDAQGHFAIDVAGMQAPLLVQVSQTRSGDTPRRWHAVVMATEVGRAWINVTPLTDIIATQVLQGLPGELLTLGTLNLRRVDAANIRAAESAVTDRLGPLLNAAGVASDRVHLRTQAFATDQQGIDQVLDNIVVFMAHGGLQWRTLQQADADALTASGDGEGGSPTVLPAAIADKPAQALAQAQALLDRWRQALAGSSADGGAAHSLLTPDFLHQGMDAQRYIARAQSEWAGATWRALRIWRMPDANQIEVQVARSAGEAGQTGPMSPAQIEHMWLLRDVSGWRMQGDRRHAAVKVTRAHVLDAEPAASTSTTAAALSLDGLMNLHTPTTGDIDTWLTERAAQSQILGRPSRRVTPYLLFEVDATRVSPQVTRILVKGPGLPGQGLSLAPPTDELAGLANWSWSHQPDDDWPGIPWGWCPPTPAADPHDCADRWLSAQTGASYRWELLDAQGRIVQTLSSALPAQSAFARLPHPSRPDWLPKLALTTHAGLQPTLGNLADTGSPWRQSGLRLPVWQMPAWPASDVTPTELRLKVHGTANVAGTVLTRQVRQPLLRTPASGIDMATVLPPGLRPIWADWQLHSRDPWGNAFVHVLAPYNPH